MKIIKTCLINGKEVALAKEDIILELNNTGRGFVTVLTDEHCVGKSAVFELGEYDHYYKWFDGFVEREQDEDNGYKKLFIREKSRDFRATIKLFTPPYHLARSRLVAYATDRNSG